MGVLDQYDPALLDEKEYDALDPESRLAADAAMMDRDRREGRFQRQRIAAALESDDGAEANPVVGAPICHFFPAN